MLRMSFVALHLLLSNYKTGAALLIGPAEKLSRIFSNVTFNSETVSGLG